MTTDASSAASSPNHRESLWTNFPSPSKQIDHNTKTRFNVNGQMIDSRRLSSAIIERVKGVYSTDAVTVNDTYMYLPGTYDPNTKLERSVPAREIKIKRNWYWRDVVPLAVFLPALNSDSIYRKTIETSLVGNYILNAKPNESDVSQIFQHTMSAMHSAHPGVKNHIPIIKGLIIKKYQNDTPFTLTDRERGLFTRNASNFCNLSIRV